jgi:hypothetical protein
MATVMMVVDHSHRHEMDIEPTAVLAGGSQPMQPVTQQQIHIAIIIPSAAMGDREQCQLKSYI